MILNIVLHWIACHVSREGADMKSWLAVSSHRAQGLSEEGAR
jgi:hemerythrin